MTLLKCSSIGLSFLVLSLAATAADPSFTEAQASAGKVAYAEHCADCHGEQLEGIDISPPLVGQKFDQTWRGNSAEVLSFHLRRMPPESVGEPGSLGDKTYADILAFVLSSNRFASGEQPLPIDMPSLAKVAIPRLPGQQYDPDKPIEPSEEQRERLNRLTEVTDAMKQDPPDEDWLQWGRTSDGQGFSPLAEIDRGNVGNLSLAWRAPLRGGPSMTVPVVHQGIMFLQTYPDTVLAIDATSGDVLWRYQYKSPMGASHKLGLALAGDKVVFATSDLHLVALDAKTGELVWKHEITGQSKPNKHAGEFALRDSPLASSYQIRSAPVVAGNKIIQGISSTFTPGGGFITGVYMDSGEEAWRFYTIARPGEPNGNTWNDLPLDDRSGGSVWHQGTYDPELNLVYYGIAPTYDTGPLLKPIAKEGHSNDALYTNCTVAVNPDTGELVWHYQHMANDQWDLDWVFERQIVDVDFKGEPRRAVMNVGKMAILDALDAETGEYLFSVDTGIQNVITAIDPETGAKTIDPAKMPGAPDCVVCPNAAGARSWPPTSYSPQTQMVYVPITETCMEMVKTERGALLSSGYAMMPAEHPDAKDGKPSRLQAIDVANQKLGWNTDVVAPLSTSTLATAGGLVFAGDVEPSLKAFDAETGEILWSGLLDDAPSSSVISYAVDGRQYVATIVGINNIHVNSLKTMYGKPVGADPMSAWSDDGRSGAALWVFALGDQ